MPPDIPSLFPTASSTIPNRSYILSITPHKTSTSNHLILSHPSSELSVIDATTLQTLDSFRGGHTGDITAVVTSTSSASAYQLGGNAMMTTGNGMSALGSVWSAGKDAQVVRWDERSRTAGQIIKAAIRGPVPLMSMAIHERENLVVAGTELTSYESHILYWDIRNASTPLYTHSSTHSDDITHLQFLPTTTSYLPPVLPNATSTHPTPPLLLLSASTDGLVALSNPKESDEEEAFYGAEALDGSIAKAGWYWAEIGRGKQRRHGVKVWARSDMDSVGTWSLGRGEEGDAQLQDPILHPTDTFKPLSLFTQPQPQQSTAKKSTRRSRILASQPVTAAEEMHAKQAGLVACDYVLDVCPSLGVNRKTGEGMIALGNNSGDIVLMHHEKIKSSSSKSNRNGDPGSNGANHSNAGVYEPSAFLYTPKDGGLGHRDVVRCMYHDIQSNVLYTGSEDGVLSGWQLPSSANLLNGDPAHDNDGGDGREDIMSSDGDSDSSADEDEDEDDKMRVDEEDEEDDMVFAGRQMANGDGKRRAAAVWGEGNGKRRRE
ncbi:hypothetical protein QFC22_004114 [Naganishia vaughanmartiniae]|uniref:Uncharacterized protein n=1 Tax=Naganishia vaughanmartiniae TaxID=1424756 RepID=A0ACC2X2F6_9TREE|nr:hypothetical protein QFC22_004114 [Naganishia vaughanmartiniae]